MNINKIMLDCKKSLLISLIISTLSCSSFVPSATNTKVEHEKDYLHIYNSELNLNSLTFLDYHILSNTKEFKKEIGENPALKEIWYYAYTSDFERDYYVIINPRTRYFKSIRYRSKDTVIHENFIRLLISKNVEDQEIDFIIKNIYEVKEE